MTEDQFRKLLEENNKRQDANLAKLFGQMSRHFDDRADADKAEMNERFDALQTALDSLAKRTEVYEKNAWLWNLSSIATMIGSVNLPKQPTPG